METTPAVLTLLGKPDCHLCHVMADVARRVAAGLNATLVERDVRDDPVLHERYGHDIPVLMFDGGEVARHRVTEAELRTRLLGLGLRAR